MNDAFAPAITALMQELKDIERKAKEIKSAINTLSKHAGVAEPYPNLDEENGVGTLSQIRADTFYGKVMGTAAREYLEMRKASGMGPATPREIYEALTTGGFLFEAKDENTALVSLRATLRKSSRIFHKLPNGQYGLLAWYPKAKQPSSDDDTGNEEEKKSAEDEVSSTAESLSSDTPINDQVEGVSEPDDTEDR